jgi:hypothetical protein
MQLFLHLLLHPAGLQLVGWELDPAQAVVVLSLQFPTDDPVIPPLEPLAKAWDAVPG